MRRSLILCSSFALLLVSAVSSPSQGIMDRLKQKAKDKLNQHTDDATTKAVDTTDNAATGAVTGPANPSTGEQPAANADAVAGEGHGAGAPAMAGPASISAYQNYDFVPGDTILFADDFTSTQDGEFPDQWELLKGQAVVNKQAGKSAMLLTEGNYVTVRPRVKSKSYLGAQYTVEYDTFVPADDNYGLIVFLDNEKGERGEVHVNASEAQYASGNSFDLSGSLPASIQGDKFRGKWHHVAFAVKNNQLKAYVDQYRVLSVPDMHNTFSSVSAGGIGEPDKPLTYTNFRVASGGNMNLVGQKFTDAKIVTHGINFDVDQATLRPESMGTLNQIKRIMTDNPDLKFEVDGHTDNSGASTHNLTLSQQRADAVKAQLVAMGISNARLTTKGFGDTKPMTTNDTQDGKANNRRVEFVKVS